MTCRTILVCTDAAHGAAALALGAALALSGCDGKKADRPMTPPPQKLAADAADSGLLAAAEPFEALARSAFVSRPPALDEDIRRAVFVAEHVKPLLPPQAQRALQTQLDALAAARRVEDRDGMAVAAVEIYRILVSYAPPEVVPREVNLLRYAGLRYEAALKAGPSHWRDMSEAAAFAARAWAPVGDKVGDPAIREGMTKALKDMADAARRQDPARAADAARRAQTQVALLEAALTAGPSS